MKNKLFLLLLLASCNFKPTLDTPHVDVPCEWRVEASQASAWCNLRWWEQFDDPVLNNYILQALEYNRDLKRAIWRVEEYDALWGIAYSELFPQLNLEGQQYRQENSLATGNFPGIPRRFNVYSLLAQMTYEIDFWGRVRNSSDAALADYLGEIDNRRTVVLTLVSDVATSYVRLRRLDWQLEISIKTLDSRNEALHINTLRFEGGLTSELEVKQAETEVQSALAAIIDIERQIEVEENLLSVLIGDSPEERERGVGLTKLLKPDFIPTGLPSDLLWQRPDLRQKEHALIAANARIGEARALYFPKISLTGFYGYQSLELHHLFTGATRTWQMGSLVDQPIFTGLKIKNQNAAAQAVEKEALYNLEYAIQNAFREVNDALITQKKANELVVVLTKQVAVLKEYLHLAELQYNNGQTDYLSVLDAQRKLFDAELTLADAEGAQFTSIVSIYKTLGGGWVVDADSVAREAICY